MCLLANKNIYIDSMELTCGILHLDIKMTQ